LRKRREQRERRRQRESLFVRRVITVTKIEREIMHIYVWKAKRNRDRERVC
jgi:hypothetical protein